MSPALQNTMPQRLHVVSKLRLTQVRSLANLFTFYLMVTIKAAQAEGNPEVHPEVGPAAPLGR